MSRKILNHPDKEDIIRMLTNGASTRSVEDKLKEKYPKDKSKHISWITIQNFRKEHLKLEGKVLQDIQDAATVQKRQIEETIRQRQLEATDAYKNKINEIADSKLDVARKILQLDTIIESRMEYWYNMIASGEETASKGDNELRKFISQQMELLGQYKKFVEGMADKTVDHNININIMNDQISVIREVIRECMAEFGPDKAMIFMDRLNHKLNNASYRPNLLGPSESVDAEDLKEIEYEVIEDETDDE